MKKLFLILALILITGTFAGNAVAAGLNGWYLAPKFIYGYTKMDHVKETGTGGDFKVGNQHDNAFGGALAIGYDFDKRFAIPFRTELEYAAFASVEADKNSYYNEDGYEGRYSVKQKYNIQTLFVNAYYDIKTNTAFTPYIGAGIGLAFIDTKYKWADNDYDLGYNSGSVSSKLRTNLAWNIGLGAAYALTENISLDAGYRFVGLGSAKTKTDYAGYHVKTKSIYMHQFYMGVRFGF